jgi:secreted trypsin-like serine protease
VVLARVVALYNSAWPTSPAIYKEGAQREMVVRRRLSVLWAAAIMLLTVLMSSGIALAVTYGQPDDNEHPYVGLVTVYDGAGKAVGSCSGTLLSPTVFLTAGHCTDGMASAKVWFDSQLTSSSPYVTGKPYTHPNFVWTPGKNTSDVGVVVLDVPVPVEQIGTYGKLPELGFLDDLATQRGLQEQTFTVVGDGTQEIPPRPQDEWVRYRGTMSLINLQNALTDGYNIQYTSNPGLRSPGGICFGDSGGPLLYDNTNTVVGITSFIQNRNCKGTGLSYRTDIANTQEFVNPFLAASSY